MKYAAVFLAVYAVGFLFLWLGFAYTGASVNPFDWEIEARFFHVFFSLIAAAVACGLYWVEDEDYDDE